MMAFFGTRAPLFEFVVYVLAVQISVIYSCEKSKLELNTKFYFSDAVVIGDVTNIVAGADAAFPTQSKSFGFNMNVKCIFQNKKRKQVSLTTNSIIYGGGYRSEKGVCHNVTVAKGNSYLILINVQDDGKTVAQFESFPDSYQEEVNFYCFMQNKLTSDDTSGTLDESVCYPVEKPPDCVSYEGSNADLNLTPAPVTPKPEVIVTPEPGKPNPEYTDATNKGGSPEPEPVENTNVKKGGQTRNGCSSSHHFITFSYLSLICLSIFFL